MTRALRSPLVLGGSVLLVLLALVAAFAPRIAPYDPRALSGPSLQSPSLHHLLGTDDIGRDILSQLVWGARSSLTVATGAAALAIVIGTLVGLGAALAGGVLEIAVMRLVDVALAIPLLPLLILVGSFVGARPGSLLLVIGLLSWPVTARVVRSQALSLRQRGFVRAARAFGAGPLYLMRRHLVPAVAPLLVSGFVSIAAHAVLLEAGLAFLGLGDPVGVSWGLMLNRALLHQGLYFTPLWTWWVLPTGVAITLAVLGFTFLGVGLEPVFNPRWRRAR